MEPSSSPRRRAAILGIRVFQTRGGASAFEIVVSDPELRWQGKPTFTDCKEVQIELASWQAEEGCSTARSPPGGPSWSAPPFGLVPARDGSVAPD